MGGPAGLIHPSSGSGTTEARVRTPAADTTQHGTHPEGTALFAPWTVSINSVHLFSHCEYEHSGPAPTAQPIIPSSIAYDSGTAGAQPAETVLPPAAAAAADAAITLSPTTQRSPAPYYDFECSNAVDDAACAAHLHSTVCQPASPFPPTTSPICQLVY